MVVLGCIIVIVIMVIVTEMEKKNLYKKIKLADAFITNKDKVVEEIVLNSTELIKDFEMLTEILEEHFTVEEINEMYNKKREERGDV